MSPTKVEQYKIGHKKLQEKFKYKELQRALRENMGTDNTGGGQGLGRQSQMCLSDTHIAHSSIFFSYLFMGSLPSRLFLAIRLRLQTQPLLQTSHLLSCLLYSEPLPPSYSFYHWPICTLSATTQAYKALNGTHLCLFYPLPCPQSLEHCLGLSSCSVVIT